MSGDRESAERALAGRALVSDRPVRRPVAEHRLGVMLRAAARGEFPAEDGEIEYVPPWRPGVEAVVSFTAHLVVATQLDRHRLEAAGIDADANAFAPAVLFALAGPAGQLDCVDVLLLSSGTGRTGLRERIDLVGHDRAAQAAAWRGDVHVHGDQRGLATISRGIGGLAELSVEVVPDRRGSGLGRSLLADARGLVAEGEPVLATVAPGNARSLRAVLAAGFTPVGAVQLIRPAADRTP